MEEAVEDVAEVVVMRVIIQIPIQSSLESCSSEDSATRQTKRVSENILKVGGRLLTVLWCETQTQNDLGGLDSLHTNMQKA